MKISWTPPEPRKGWLGSWDKFVGPGATSAEEWLQLVGGLALAAAVAGYLYLIRAQLDWSIIQIAIVAFLLLDTVGGIITNATSTAKRWYHRDGQGRKQLLGFIALHGVHLFVIAWLFRDMDWIYFAILYGYLIMTTIVTVATPLYLQRPLVMTFYAAVLILEFALFSPAPGLEWFVPFLFLKLLVCHLPPEAPFRPEEEAG